MSKCRSAGRSEPIALDLGCGVGKWVPALALRCTHVFACDISPQLLDVAMKSTKRFRINNVTFATADIAEYSSDEALAEGLSFPKGDMVVCANVLISPNEVTRQRIFSRVCGCMSPSGTLLMLIPSAESAQRVREARQMYGAKRLGKDSIGDHKSYAEDEAQNIYRCGGACRCTKTQVISLWR